MNVVDDIMGPVARVVEEVAPEIERKIEIMGMYETEVLRVLW
jgi:hypothetical protein